jgi:ABC-type multidrug transport system permease subunit
MENKNILVITMIKSNLKSEYNKLSMLTKMEVKRILNQLSNVVLLILLLILFVNMFIFISKNNEVKIHSKVAIAVEDNSFEVNTLMKNITENKLKGIINFEETTLESGLKMLKEREVIAVIHVDEGTTELLNSGKATSFNLYIEDSSDIVVGFLTDYLKNLVKVLNEGQSGAMIYWDIMKSEGFDFDGRIKELNRVALSYMSAFLTRGGVFEDSTDLDKFYGTALINYYFSAALIIVAIISAIMFHIDIDDDFNKGRIRRVLSSGFSPWHVYFAKIIAGVAFSTLLLILFQTLYLIYFDTFSLGVFLRFIISSTMLNAIINMLVIIFYIAISNDTIRDVSFFIVFSLLIFTSGIILPLSSMDRVFKLLSRFNILTIGHHQLLGYTLTFERVLVISLYFILLIVLIKYSHRKRRDVE